MRAYHIPPTGTAGNEIRLYISTGFRSNERPKLKQSGWKKIAAEDAYRILGADTARRIMRMTPHASRGLWVKDTAGRTWHNTGHTTDDLGRGEKLA